jgi:hypothetical protein
VFRKVLDEVFSRDLDVTVFSKNRGRLLRGEVARGFFQQVPKLARQRDLLSDEHFTVDGTLIKGSAGQKSFRKIGRRHPVPEDPGNPTLDFQGKKRSNQTPPVDDRPRGSEFASLSPLFFVFLWTLVEHSYTLPEIAPGNELHFTQHSAVCNPGAIGGSSGIGQGCERTRGTHWHVRLTIWDGKTNFDHNS